MLVWGSLNKELSKNNMLNHMSLYMILAKYRAWWRWDKEMLHLRFGHVHQHPSQCLLHSKMEEEQVVDEACSGLQISSLPCYIGAYYMSTCNRCSCILRLWAPLIPSSDIVESLVRECHYECRLMWGHYEGAYDLLL